MKKRLLLLLCLIATAGSAAWAGIIAQNTFSSGGSWKITDDGELYVDAVTIPDYKDIYEVNSNRSVQYTGTTAPWSSYKDRIRTIRFSSRVHTIGKWAFAVLTKVSTTTFESKGSVHIIKGHAFYYTPLSTFDFTNVTEIGDQAFYGNHFFYDTLPRCIELPVLEKVGVEAFSCIEENWEWSRGHAPSCDYEHVFYLSGNKVPVRTSEKPRNYYNPSFINGVIVPPSMLSQYARWHLNSVFNNNIWWDYCGVMAGGTLPDNGFWCVENHHPFLHVAMHNGGDFQSSASTPWYQYRDQITRIYLHDTSGYGGCVGANTFNGFSDLVLIKGLDNFNKINNSAFANCVNLSSLTFAPYTVVGNSAFKGCSTLKRVDLTPIKEFGTDAFNQTAFKEIHIGTNVSSIGANAFDGNTVTTVYVTSDCPPTNANAFGTGNLGNIHLYMPINVSGTYTGAPWKNMTIHETVEFPVNGYASGGNPAWTLYSTGMLIIKGNVPNYSKVSEQPWYLYRDFIHNIQTEGVTSIGNNALAFENAGESKVTTIYAPSVKIIGANAFRNNDKLKVFYLSSAQTIGDYAFAGCSAIEEYTFGSDLKTIGSHAFDGCENVDVMALTAANPPDVTAETFKGMGSASGSQGRRRAAGTGQKSVTLDVPDEYLTKYLANPYWRLFSFYAGEYGSIVDSGNFGDGLWILYDNGTMVVSADKGPGNSYAEGSAQALGFGTTSNPRSAISLTKRVEFMGNITHLGWGFQHFPNLESVRLCPSIMRLDDTFESCAKLTDINLENVDTIGDWTFARSGVQNISLPRASYIGRGAFYKCKELQTVSLGTTCEVCKEAFFYCDQLTDINLADAQLDGAKECFSSCYKLKNVTFSGKYLPSRIFSNCFALERIDLGTRVDSISFDAFDGCSALNTVYCANPTPPAMPWGKRKIGEEYYDAQAFYGRNLKNIHLYLPAGFQFPYSKADVWKGMTFEVDLSYTEDLLPTGGAVGEDGTWYIDTDGTLTIDFEGGSSSVNIGGSNIGWHDLLASWMPFLTKVVVSDRVNYVPYHMAGEHDPAWSAGVESVELGASVKTLQDQSLNYSGIKDVYCYAESCPSCSRTAFDWDAIAANNATLHVVTSQGVLERYQNSKTWSKFPNIVADLTSRMPAGIFSVTNPEGLVMWFRVTDEAAKTCETYHNDIVGKAIEYNSYGHYEKITVPATVTYNGDTYKVTGIGDNSFYGCTNVDTFILPEGLERIGVNAFNYCFGVHEFTLPASVQYIGEYAFEMWTNIERFTVNGTTPPTVDENFINTYWDPDLRPKPTLLVPDGCRDAWNVEPWNKWFNVVDPFNKGVLTYKVIPGASFYDYYQNDEEYMCIEGLMALGIITYQDEMVGREWDELIGDWNEIWGNVYYNKNGKKLFYLDDESCIRIFDGVSSADNIYYEFKTEDYETMMYTTGHNVDLYKGARIVFPESNVQTDIYFTATNADGIDISYRVLDLSKKTCEVKADPNGYGSNAVATDVSEVKVPYLADGYVVTGIAADAFNSLSSLQNVTLPLSIRTIGANAFGYCENVVSVFIDCEYPPMLLDQDGFLTDENNYAFENIGVPAGTGIGGAMLYVPSGSEELYNVYPWNYWFSMGIAPDPDGIASPKSSPERKDFNWFDLSGRRVAHPTKGIYIFNGRKVVK